MRRIITTITVSTTNPAAIAIRLIRLSPEKHPTAMPSARPISPTNVISLNSLSCKEYPDPAM